MWCQKAKEGEQGGYGEIENEIDNLDNLDNKCTTRGPHCLLEQDKRGKLSVKKCDESLKISGINIDPKLLLHILQRR